MRILDQFGRPAESTKPRVFGFGPPAVTPKREDVEPRVDLIANSTIEVNEDEICEW